MSPFTSFHKTLILKLAFGILLLFVLLAGSFWILALFNIDWPTAPNQTHLESKLLPPGPGHWLGTDPLGRDVLARILYGSSISLTVGFVAVLVSLGIGVSVGAISGYLGGWIDNLLMRLVDALLCFPDFFLILTAVALLGPSIWNVILVIGLVSWTGTARLVRAEFLTLREMEYIRAAQALGSSSIRIITKHLLPNAFPPIFVTALIGIPTAILMESGLSFLGFGVQPPQATWGNIIAEGKTYFLDAWWLIFFPGLAIFLTTFSFFVVGESWRERLNS